MSIKKLGLALIMGVIVTLATNPFLMNDLKYDPMGTRMTVFGGVIGGTIVWYIILTVAHKAINTGKSMIEARKKSDTEEELK